MKIKEIKVKSIITKSGLPDSDFVINPYIGCQHNCLYCYACFMKRFTNHQEPWGQFVDVKLNASDLIKDMPCYKGKSITIGSVTDPYQPLELKYKITRKILEKLINFESNIYIITKSDIILRDIDIIKKLHNCIVAFSICTLDENVRKQLEPFASPIERRIKALKSLHHAGIKTVVFISPILPEVTDWKEIIDKTRDFTIEYWFENINLYPSIQENIIHLYKKNNLSFTENNIEYWDSIEDEIRSYCKDLKFSIYFHHLRK